MARLTVDVRDLELVEALAEFRGLAKAAERLHVSASALSHQLRQLEERLGVTLFVRGPRHMAPTSAGERLLRAGIPVLRELRQAEEEIGVLDSERRGILRVCVERYPSYLWLPEILSCFQKQFPRVEVRTLSRTDGVLDAVLAREIDLAIVSGDLRRSGIRVCPLFRDEMVAVMAERHPLAQKPYIERTDLAGVRTMAVPGEACEDWPDPMWRIPFIDLMVELARHDLGIGLLPMWIAASAAQAGSIVTRKITRAGTFRDWFIVHRDENTAGYVSTFVEALFRRPPSARSHFGAHSRFED
jgi:LysR family transcriptional regulator for metE and metH